MRLIKYELDKSLNNKAAIVIWFLLVFINCFKIISVYQNESMFADKDFIGYTEGYERLYRDLKGEISTDNTKWIFDQYEQNDALCNEGKASFGKSNSAYTYNIYSDNILYKYSFINQLSYELGYKQYANNIVFRAIKNMEISSERGNDYLAYKDYMIATAFNNRELTFFYNTVGYRELTSYSFSSLLNILLIAILTAASFSNEEETDMVLILRTTTNGSLSTSFSKILSVAIIVIITFFSFCMTDICLFFINFEHMDAGSQPIYIIEKYMNSPLNVRLNMMIMIIYLYRLLGLLIIAELCMLVSLFTKSNLFSVLFSTIVIGCCYALFVLKSHYFNPIILFFPDVIFCQTDFIRFLGVPIHKYQMILFSNVSIFFVLNILIIVFWKRMYSHGNYM